MSFLLGIATMKENKGKEVMGEGVKSQPRPPTGEKRKNISSRVDLGLQYKSSKPQDVKSPPASNQESPVQILSVQKDLVHSPCTHTVYLFQGSSSAPLRK